MEENTRLQLEVCVEPFYARKPISTTTDTVPSKPALTRFAHDFSPYPRKEESDNAVIKDQIIAYLRSEKERLEMEILKGQQSSPSETKRLSLFRISLQYIRARPDHPGRPRHRLSIRLSLVLAVPSNTWGLGFGVWGLGFGVWVDAVATEQTPSLVANGQRWPSPTSPSTRPIVHPSDSPSGCPRCSRRGEANRDKR